MWLLFEFSLKLLPLEFNSPSGHDFTLQRCYMDHGLRVLYVSPGFSCSIENMLQSGGEYESDGAQY